MNSMNYITDRDRVIYNDSSNAPNQFYTPDPIGNYSNSKNIPSYGLKPIDDSPYLNSPYTSSYVVLKETSVPSLVDLSKSTYSVLTSAPDNAEIKKSLHSEINNYHGFEFTQNLFPKEAAKSFGIKEGKKSIYPNPEEILPSNQLYYVPTNPSTMVPQTKYNNPPLIQELNPALKSSYNSKAEPLKSTQSGRLSSSNFPSSPPKTYTPSPATLELISYIDKRIQEIESGAWFSSLYSLINFASPSYIPQDVKKLPDNKLVPLFVSPQSVQQPEKIEQPLQIQQQKDIFNLQSDLKPIQNQQIVQQFNPNMYLSSSFPPKVPETQQKTQKLELKTITSEYGGVKVAKDFVDDPNSIYNTLIAKLQASGTKFTDAEFPPEVRSLIAGKNLTDLPWDPNMFIWLRPDEFYGSNNFKMYQGGISSEDIKQGELGDCYFLSTLSALAEWPHRIEKLIVSKDVNPLGCYAVRICDMGEWKEIILDDLFPCYNDDKNLSFAKGNGNELWVLLIEKAWAKLYTSFAKIEAGLTREALHDLTGAPTKYFYISEMTEPEKEELWHEIIQGEKMNYAMTCGSYGNDDTEEKDGIFFGHAYSLLSAFEVLTNWGKERLLRIRNPHSHGEWTGNWSDKSSIWTPELKSQVGFVDEDDGAFFMSFRDFFSYFEDVEVCKIHDDYHYTSLKVNITHKNGTYYKIKIPKDGKYYITANQQSTRHHDDSENFQYSPVWLILAKQEADGSIKHIEGCYKADREVWTDGHLIAGEYLVYVKIAWYDEGSRDFVLSSYGPEDVTITKVEKKELPEFMQKVFIDQAKKSKKMKSYQNQGQPKCYQVIETTNEGYTFIYYLNQSNRTLVEDVKFSVLQGKKLCKPFRGDQYQIRVAPGEEKIVLLKEDYWADSIGHSLSSTSRFE